MDCAPVDKVEIVSPPMLSGVLAATAQAAPTLPGSMLVTTKHGELESKETLKRRIEEAARYVPIEQLCLSPQCGFSSTVEGNALSYEQEVAKLRLIVETAAEVWG